MDTPTFIAVGIAAHGAITAAFAYYVKAETYRAISENNEQLVKKINGTYLKTEVWRDRILRLEKHMEGEDE